MVSAVPQATPLVDLYERDTSFRMLIHTFVRACKDGASTKNRRSNPMVLLERIESVARVTPGAYDELHALMEDGGDHMDFAPILEQAVDRSLAGPWVATQIVEVGPVFMKQGQAEALGLTLIKEKPLNYTPGSNGRAVKSGETFQYPYYE